MKRMMQALVALSLALGLAVPSIAMAQEDKGFYLGASIGQSSADGFCDLFGPGISCKDTDTAWRIFGGYQFNKNFALEGGYHKFGEVTASDPTGRLTFEAEAFEFLAVGILPLAEKFSLYGKVGLYMGDTTFSGVATPGPSFSLSGDNTDLTFAFGVRYDFTPNFGVRAEWQRYQDLGGSDVLLEGDLDVMSIGLVYRFR